MCVHVLLVSTTGCFIDEELLLPYAIEVRKVRHPPRQERCEITDTALSQHFNYALHCTLKYLLYSLGRALH